MRAECIAGNTEAVAAGILHLHRRTVSWLSSQKGQVIFTLSQTNSLQTKGRSSSELQGKPSGYTALIKQRWQEELQMYTVHLTCLCSDCQSQCESSSPFNAATEGLDKGCAQYRNTAAAAVFLLPDTFHLREPAELPCYSQGLGEHRSPLKCGSQSSWEEVTLRQHAAATTDTR